MYFLHPITIAIIIDYFTVNAITSAITITTEDHGKGDAGSTPDIYKYYTNLSDHEIKLNSDEYITFQLKSRHNSYILLSAAKDLVSEKFYEIGLGVHKSYKYAILRKFKDKKRLVEVPNILSGKSFKIFWISWKSGHVAIGRGSVINNETFLDWTDSDPIDVKGIGVMSTWRSSATWLFVSEGTTVSKSTNEQTTVEMTETVDNKCVCDCKPQDKNRTLSSEEIKAIQIETEKTLRIDKHNTSFYKGTKMSAADDRISSVSIGFVGVAVIVFVVAFIVFLDFLPTPDKNKTKHK